MGNKIDKAKEEYKAIKIYNLIIIVSIIYTLIFASYNAPWYLIVGLSLITAVIYFMREIYIENLQNG